ncbi:MAG: guanine deaminase [Deltaproteobacteria bacterium]|nr:guanine deaminase [Deltaproteobacteria bacterium]
MTSGLAKSGVRGSLLFARPDRSLAWHADGVCVWDAAGRICAADAWTVLAPQLPATAQIAHWPQHLITPGFIDCHVHLPQLDCRHRHGYRLLDWLERFIFPAEAAFADTAVARDTARRFFTELLRHGTTTALIYCTIHEAATQIAFEEAAACGIRAIIGKVMMDRHSPPALTERTSESLAATERLLARWHGHDDRLYYAVTPRFALTSSDTLLREAGKIAAQGHAYFQTHIAEVPEEVARAHELFGVTDYVGLFADCGCLGPHSLFAHAIYLTDPEWARLAAAQATVAHCPSSNLFLQSGRMPYAKMCAHGVRCGLGTDVGAGPEFALWDVMARGVEQHGATVFTPDTAFYHATLGGAHALGLATTTGSLLPGLAADLVVTPLPTPCATADSALAQLMQHWQRHVPAATYINGTRVWPQTVVNE